MNPIELAQIKLEIMRIAERVYNSLDNKLTLTAVYDELAKKILG